MSGLRVEALTRSHRVGGFRSGADELDLWLERFALVADAAGTARTYLLVDESEILGYYALAMAQVDREELPDRHRRGTSRHPVPMVLLARLAVHEDAQGRGFGALLLADAAIRAVRASAEVAARGLLVHARDEVAVLFYEHFGFVRSPSDPMHLVALMKDLRSVVGLD